MERMRFSMYQAVFLELKMNISEHLLYRRKKLFWLKYLEIIRLAWEVGNTHTPLFAGAQMGEFAMPWSEPLMALLRHLPGVTADVGVVALDGMQRLGGGGAHVHHHAHSHGHDYDHGHVHAHDQGDEHEEEL